MAHLGSPIDRMKNILGVSENLPSLDESGRVKFWEEFLPPPWGQILGRRVGNLRWGIDLPGYYLQGSKLRTLSPVS